MKRFLGIALLLLLSVPLKAQQLPQVPIAIPSQLGGVRVIRVPNLKCNDEAALGCFVDEQRVILLRDSVSLIVTWQTFYHESCHVAMWDSGMHSMIGNAKKEDAICDAFASFQTMQLISVVMARRP